MGVNTPAAAVVVAPHRRWRGQHGQATPLALVVVVLAIVATLAIAYVGRLVVDAGRARTAADAAALAGVDGGHEASARLAAEHDATIVSWSSSGPPDAVTVTVTVRVGAARATAAATNRGP
jgi:Flp pilus assembly protein TadG